MVYPGKYSMCIWDECILFCCCVECSACLLDIVGLYCWSNPILPFEVLSKCSIHYRKCSNEIYNYYCRMICFFLQFNGCFSVPNKVLLEHSRTHLILYTASVWQQSTWIFETGIIWPSKFKLFTIWDYAEQVYRKRMVEFPQRQDLTYKFSLTYLFCLIY